MIGGPELAAHAFRLDLIDECHLFIMPIILEVVNKCSLTTFGWSVNFWRNIAFPLAPFSFDTKRGKENQPKEPSLERLDCSKGVRGIPAFFGSWLFLLCGIIAV